MNMWCRENRFFMSLSLSLSLSLQAHLASSQSVFEQITLSQKQVLKLHKQIVSKMIPLLICWTNKGTTTKRWVRFLLRKSRIWPIFSLYLTMKLYSGSWTNQMAIFLFEEPNFVKVWNVLLLRRRNCLGPTSWKCSSPMISFVPIPGPTTIQEIQRHPINLSRPSLWGCWNVPLQDWVAHRNLTLLLWTWTSGTIGPKNSEKPNDTF